MTTTRTRLLLAALTAAGLLVTFVVTSFAVDGTRRSQEGRVQMAGEAARTTLVTRLEALKSGLTTVRDAAMVEAVHLGAADASEPWAADGALSLELFRQAIEDGSLQAVRSAGLLRTVPLADLATYEAATGVAVHPRPSDTAYVLERRYPDTVDPSVLGFDLGSEPSRRAAIERARDAADITMSGAIELITTGDTAIILFIPIYSGTTIPETVAERRATFVGTINAVVEPLALMREVGAGQSLRASLLDLGPASTATNTDTDTGDPAPAEPSLLAGDPIGPEHLLLDVDAGDRRWQLAVVPGTGFPPADMIPLVVVPVAGLLLTVAVAAIAHLLAGREARARTLVARRTADLEASRAALERANDDLARANAELVESDAIKTQFLVTVSHELRTPLTSIRGFASLLAAEDEQLSADDRRQFALELERSATALSGLLQEVLEFAEMDHQGARTTPIATPIGVPLSRAVAAQPSTHPITLSGDTSCWGMADPQALQRAVTNLLTNARSYSPPGSPIEVHIVCDGDDGVTIHVDDRGPGIPEDERRQVFQRFHRGSAASAGQVPGTGIGLTVVHKLVTDMGGTVQAADAPGGGARLTLGLRPAQRTPAVVEAGR